MASSKRKADEMEGNVTGICYEAKLSGESVDVDNPLYGTCYFGIAVRHGRSSPEALQLERQREHEAAAKSDPKALGIRAVLALYGPQGFEWRIVDSKTGKDKLLIQEWANAWEKSAISAAGGLLRDLAPEKPIRQTFNLKSGGQGDASLWWGSVEARSVLAWKKFQSALNTYLKENKTVRMLKTYTDKSGYCLGDMVSFVRGGGMLTGRSDEVERRAYLQALPGWVWNANDRAWEEFKVAMIKYVRKTGSAYVPSSYVDEDGFAIGMSVFNIRRGQMIHNKKDMTQRQAWLNSLPGWKWSVTKAEGAAHLQAEIALLRETTHPNVSWKGFKKLRDDHCVIRAHEVMRNRVVASVIDDLIDRAVVHV